MTKGYAKMLPLTMARPGAVQGGVLLELLFGGAYGAVVIGSRLVASRRNAKLAAFKDRWQNLASQLGWLYYDAHGAGLEARIHGITIAIRASMEAGVQIAAEARAPSHFSLRIERRGIRRTSISVGQPFDGAFAMDSTDPDLARAWVSRTTVHGLATVAKASYAFSIELRDGEIVAEVGATELSAKELETVAEIVAALATRQARLRARWTALAEALEGVVDGDASFPPPPIAVTRRARLVTLSLVHGEDHWVTRLELAPMYASEEEPASVELPGLVLDVPKLEHTLATLLGPLEEQSGPYR